MNPATCGVARFNALLAQQLDVPLLHIFDDRVLAYHAPLLSVKVEEFPSHRMDALGGRVEELLERQKVRVFLHTFGNTPIERRLIGGASAVYCGNSELVAQLRPWRPDAVELWCPGTIPGGHRLEPVELSVLSFGMAHKVRAEYYHRLHQLLETTGKTYALYISTALHENTSFEQSFDGAFAEIRHAFGTHAHFLGFLSDTNVYNHVLDATYVAAFFERGVRANNTSVNSAMACGAVVITNLDEHSPGAFRHEVNVLDINQLRELPTDRPTLRVIGERAKQVGAGQLGWPAFIARLTAIEAEISPRAAIR